jgi:hypothetical protein
MFFSQDVGVLRVLATPGFDEDPETLEKSCFFRKAPPPLMPGARYSEFAAAAMTPIQSKG